MLNPTTLEKNHDLAVRVATRVKDDLRKAGLLGDVRGGPDVVVLDVYTPYEWGVHTGNFHGRIAVHVHDLAVRRHATITGDLATLDRWTNVVRRAIEKRLGNGRVTRNVYPERNARHAPRRKPRVRPPAV